MPENTGIEKYIRPHFAGMVGYSAATNPETLEGKTAVPPQDIIKLDANENPYGCSPRVKKALASYDGFGIYPDADQTEVRRLLSTYAGVGAERIVAGAGSDEIIDLLLRLFLEPGDEVMTCVPTFDMYRFSTQVCGGRFVEVKRDPDFSVNVSALKAAITPRTRVIFLTSPNNPSGNIIPGEDILEVVKTGLPVVIDEAYYEFCGETVVPLVSRYDNLMVLRTFSKWAGLAGLRIGYGILPVNIASYLLNIKPPYNINLAAQVAVKESLKDIEYLRSTVQKIIEERDRLFSELNKLSFLKPFPSRANFILCAVLKGNALAIRDTLKQKGILVRYYDTPLLRNYIRISAGKPEHTERVIRELRQIEESVNG